jgi:hypothetical protein
VSHGEHCSFTIRVLLTENTVNYYSSRLAFIIFTLFGLTSVVGLRNQNILWLALFAVSVGGMVWSVTQFRAYCKGFKNGFGRPLDLNHFQENPTAAFPILGVYQDEERGGFTTILIGSDLNQPFHVVSLPKILVLKAKRVREGETPTHVKLDESGDKLVLI